MFFTHTSLTGRDSSRGRSSASAHFISTHTPLAGRDRRRKKLLRAQRNISTHTPLAGRDVNEIVEKYWDELFLLTRPLRDVTHPGSTSLLLRSISTHTPLAGRDSVSPCCMDPQSYFYSHAPCGT